MLIAEYSYETDMEVKIGEATEELRKEAALEIEKAKKEAEKSEKARKEEEKKRAEAEKMFVDVVDNVMEMYQISAEQACERIRVPFERYKAIKKSIDGTFVE